MYNVSHLEPYILLYIYAVLNSASSFLGSGEGCHILLGVYFRIRNPVRVTVSLQLGVAPPSSKHPTWCACVHTRHQKTPLLVDPIQEHQKGVEHWEKCRKNQPQEKNVKASVHPQQRYVNISYKYAHKSIELHKYCIYEVVVVFLKGLKHHYD